ncbi:MAG: restriction endonuclease [Akkermansiaceae bacterium]|nr:restriction endonuclease [Armatimonadota bacterium]
MTLPSPASHFAAERQRFHASLLRSVLQVGVGGVVTNADKDSKLSVAIAAGIYSLLTFGTVNPIGQRLPGQTSGNTFEDLVASFLRSTFVTHLQHLRPGTWHVERITSRQQSSIPLANYEQYKHLSDLQKAVVGNNRLRAILGQGYVIAPDVVVSRDPEDDHTINGSANLIDQTVARRASLRKGYNPDPILHASISMKWTIRSDRAQNARSEALNLIRNRKGKLPHVAIVTGEPLPSRIASIALGTGDIDCVYHFALYELYETISTGNYPDALEMLDIMIDGKRLKDISDLPLDLAL